jgi:hypothetical protein
VAPTFSTSEVAAAQASGVATPGGAVPAALPNQALRKESGAAGPSGGAPEAPGIEVAEEQAQPQAAALATSVVQFFAGLDDFVARARRWTLPDALGGPLTRAEGRAALPRRLGTLLARWSPIVAGLRSPALTLAVDLIRAALTTSSQAPGAGEGEGVGDPGAARPAASTRSDHATTEEPTAAVPGSPLEFTAAAIGLGTVAWAQVHARRRPRRNRQHAEF